MSKLKERPMAKVQTTGAIKPIVIRLKPKIYNSQEPMQFIDMTL